MRGVTELAREQAALAERLRAGDEPAARRVLGKRLEGIARWMPASTARLREAGWLERVLRRYLASASAESTDPWSDAGGFERFLRAAPMALDGLDAALDEDSARLALLGPAAPWWGAVLRGGRVFGRRGRDIRQVWPRPGRVSGGGGG